MNIEAQLSDEKKFSGLDVGYDVPALPGMRECEIQDALPDP